ncbi:MAG TPA: hypothetical protein VK502_00220 [Candidatus Saccharimonadales bacterium]|nr:hypothetical protein [Candidatus Saccharimonadales bacterium]
MKLRFRHKTPSTISLECSSEPTDQFKKAMDDVIAPNGFLFENGVLTLMPGADSSVARVVKKLRSLARQNVISLII